MRFKIYLLTILVALLTFFSFYIVYSDWPQSSFWSGHFQNFSPASFPANGNNGDLDARRAYILPIAEPNYLPAKKQNWPDPELSAKSFLLYDDRNGRIIFSKNIDQPLPVASLTKLMTAVLAMEYLPVKSVVTINPESYRVDGETADFYPGEQLYFEDLLAVMLIRSSNDAAVALSLAVETKVGGHFFYLMNSKARELGMYNSAFLDPAGLSDDAYSTAKDLLKLARYSQKYPLIWQFLRFNAIDIISADGRYAHHYSSTNRLLGQWPETIGGKTGYTEGALGCMILEVKIHRGEHSLLAIVLGSASRFEDTKNLIDWGQNAFYWE